MRKLYDVGIVILIITMVVTVVGGMAHKFSTKEHPSGKEEFRGDDAPVEEACEDILEIMTSKDVDLTPESPEE